LFIVPQLEQVLELGSNLPIFNMFVPYHSDLYSNILTNVPQLTSAMCLDNL
jgi:hypothetical protein